MHYQFESKIAVEVPQEKSLLQKLCMIGGALGAVATLATIIMDGVQGVSFLTGVFVPGFLLVKGFSKRFKIDYVATPVSIELTNNKVTISYPSVKRHVNDAAVVEVYEFFSGNIDSLQYSAELNAVRFFGSPIVSINGKKEEHSGEKRERVVYLPPNSAKEICADLEKYLNFSIENMDK